MRRFVITGLVASVVLAGCGGIRDSRINPFNWFGGDTETRVQTVDAAAARDDQLIDQIVSLTVDPTPGGAIVSVIGLPVTQGYWRADLVRQPSDDPAQLILEFRIKPPLGTTRHGTPPSREVLGGTFLSTQTMNGVRQIVVVAAQNQRAVARR
jgi:hypothetical protein